MTKIENIKTHVKKYKAVYITGSVCLVVGAVSGGAYMYTRPEIQQIAKMQNIGLTWKPTQTVVQFVERSNASKPVHLVGTQQYFDSIHAAARETGLDRSLISRNVAGLIPDVKGSVFEIVDVAA